MPAKRGSQTYTFDTVAEMVAFAHKIDGQTYHTLRYSTSHTVGDGSGNSYCYHSTGRPTADGGFYIDSDGADDYFEAASRGLARLSQFGGVPDDATDAAASLAAATAAAISSGVALEVDGDYFLGSADISVDGSLTVRGPGSLRATDNTVDIWLGNGGGSIKCQNLTVSGFSSLLHLGSSVSFGDIDITSCVATSLGAGLVKTRATGPTTVGNVRIRGNQITDTVENSADQHRGAIHIKSGSLGKAVIAANIIENVGSNTHASAAHGIYLQATASQFESVVTGNQVRNVRNNSLLECDGIVVLAARAVISNNVIHTVESANASNVDQEGIYTKADHSCITGNLLIDAGGNEGSVICKGNSDRTAADDMGTDSLISCNSIFRTTALTDSTAIVPITGCLVSGNLIDGYTRGILPSKTDTFDIVIRGNKIRNFQAVSGDLMVGVGMNRGGDFIVEGNHFSDFGNAASTTGCYLIYLTSQSGDTHGDLVVRSNHACNGRSTTNERGIFITIGSGATAESVTVEDNFIADCSSFGMNLRDLGTVSDGWRVRNNQSKRNGTNYSSLNIDHLVSGNSWQPADYTGSGTPEGVVTAPISSTFRRTDGGTGTTLYVKESGTGNTGWVAK